MADVFISYHEASAGEIVRQIAAALESVGISCWYAQRDLIGPGSFAAIIAKAIRDCKVFLLVMNEESNRSEHVKNEIGVAFHRISNHEEMALALFRLDDCVLPDEVYYYLNRFQITDGNPPDAEHIQKLVEQIPRILGYPKQLATQPPPIQEMAQETIQKLEERIRKLQELNHKLTQKQQQIQDYMQVPSDAREQIQALKQAVKREREQKLNLQTEFLRERDLLQKTVEKLKATVFSLSILSGTAILIIFAIIQALSS